MTLLLIKSIKNLFFLPPPHTNVSSSDNFLEIISAVSSVIVAAPSSKERPLAKEISKSLISSDFFLLALI